MKNEPISPKVHKALSIFLILQLIFTPSIVFALPTNYQFEEGVGTFEEVFNHDTGVLSLHITASANSIITYDTFNIGLNEEVRFTLPTANDFSLNRVLGDSYSEILGGLYSNGNIIIVNTNGFHFGSTANVNVNGLIASTHDISNQDFLSGVYQFEGQGAGSDPTSTFILNEGQIIAHDRGMIILIADAIENKGTISAPLGTAALAAGNLVTVGISPDGSIAIGIDEETAHTILDHNGNPITEQIKNSTSGQILASSGHLILNAKGSQSVFHQAINLDGVVKADTVVEGEDGTIEFIANGDIYSNADISADEGEVLFEASGDIWSVGSLKAKKLTESGASFKIAGVFHVGESFHDNLDNAIEFLSDISLMGTFNDEENIIIDNDVIVTLTGETSFIADSNADGSGFFEMRGGSQIVGNGNNLTVSASEDSVFKDLIDIGTLTLQESGTSTNPDFVSDPLNDVMDVADFRIQGGRFNRFTNDGLDTLIHDIYGLQALIGFVNDSGVRFKLANDIDASQTVNWNDGDGFSSIGGFVASYSGVFDGDNHTITGLHIDSGHDNIGLFARLQDATVQNLNFADANIVGEDNVGVLVGSASDTIISNVHGEGSVLAEGHVGGLVGRADAIGFGEISDSSFIGNVTAIADGDIVGGLVGRVEGGVQVYDSFSIVNVVGDVRVGGLIGWANNPAFIYDSYSKGTVSGNDRVGGFVGDINDSVIILDSHSTANVIGDAEVGGFAGISRGLVLDSYSTGDVTGRIHVGGLVGYIEGSAMYSRGYALGSVQGEESVGAIVGTATGFSSIQETYWNFSNNSTHAPAGDVQGGATVASTGLFESQFTQQSSFPDFGFGGIWQIDEGESEPYTTTVGLHTPNITPEEFLNQNQGIPQEVTDAKAIGGLDEKVVDVVQENTKESKGLLDEFGDNQLAERDKFIKLELQQRENNQEFVNKEEQSEKEDLDIDDVDEKEGDEEFLDQKENEKDEDKDGDLKNNNKEKDESDKKGPESFDHMFQFGKDEAIDIETEVEVIEGKVHVQDINAKEEGILLGENESATSRLNQKPTKPTPPAKPKADPKKKGDPKERHHKIGKKDSPRMNEEAESPSPTAPEFEPTTMQMDSSFGEIGPVAGQVLIRKDGANNWIKAIPGMILREKDEMKTSVKSKAKIYLDKNSSRGELTLGQQSHMKLSALSKNKKTGAKKTQIDLGIGDILVKAGKLKGKSKFKVRTPSSIVSIRGTIFKVTVKDKN